jgi:hypothetical protein
MVINVLCLLILPIRVGAAKCLPHLSFLDFFMFAAPLF